MASKFASGSTMAPDLPICVGLPRMRGHMRSVAAITADIDKLRTARAKSAKSVSFGDRRVEYRSDDEIARAITALEAELEQATASPRSRTIVVRSPEYKTGSQ